MPADESKKQLAPTAAATPQLRSLIDTLRDLKKRRLKPGEHVRLSGLGQITVVSVGSSEKAPSEKQDGKDWVKYQEQRTEAGGVVSEPEKEDAQAQSPNEIEAQRQETFHQRLKRLSQNTQSGNRFVKGSSLGPITFFPAHPPAEPEEPPALTLRELTEDEGFNLLWGPRLEREAQEHKEAEPEATAIKEPSEEDKVRELFEAYQRSGEDGIREVLRHRNEEYVRKQQGQNLKSDSGEPTGS